VVHRLEWDDRSTPRQRRPVVGNDGNWDVSLHGSKLYVTRGDYEDDDTGEVDMSRCEQLLTRSPQELYGCGLCLIQLLRAAQDNRRIGTRALLRELDDALDQGLLNYDNNTSELGGVGVAWRPRVYVVAMALFRMRGAKFEKAPDDGESAARDQQGIAAEREVERKKKELLDAWNNRRRKKNFNEQFK